MVPLSWFMKKNENLNLGKKSSFCTRNGGFELNRLERTYRDNIYPMKNRNLNLAKKSSFCIENGTFYLKLSVIKLKSSIFSTKWTFFRQVQISIFLHKSTQWDHRRLLHKFQKGIFFFTVSVFVLMRQYLLKITTS